MGMVFYFAIHSEIIPSVKEKSIEKLNFCGNRNDVILTISEIKLTANIVIKNLCISTIDTGEQMIAIRKTHFD
jgi:hypothetical protein